MVILDTIVRIPDGVMQGVRQQLLNHAKQRCSKIRGDLFTTFVTGQDHREKRTNRRKIASFRHGHINNLAELVDFSVHVTPPETAISAGRPGSIAVDVFETEPLLDTSGHYIQHPNVIATPHIGYVTEDEWDLQFTDIYEQINAFEAGNPINIINPDARQLP